jgi:hypothetical protein
MDGAIGNCKKLKTQEPVEEKDPKPGTLHENKKIRAKKPVFERNYNQETCLRIRNPEPGKHF